MQAMHDLLYHRSNLSEYDHLEFSGVVPRTFIGSLAVSLCASPICFILSLARVVPVSAMQIVCRLVLGTFTWHGFSRFYFSMSKKFSVRVAKLAVLLVSSQFHLPFYMSRPLPNIFALILALHSFSYWLSDRPYHCLALLTFATVVFRCDVLILLGPITLLMLFSGEVRFIQTAQVGITTGIVALTITVLIDSIFWRRWLWPEGVVLFFNAVENKSSEWGVMPWHWYFSHALPKSMHISLLLIILGAIGFQFPSIINAEAFATKKTDIASSQIKDDTITTVSVVRTLFGGPDLKALYYGFPALIFICLYSFLPHKELRFIFPALPLLVLMAASALDSILPINSRKLIFPLSTLLASQNDSSLSKVSTNAFGTFISFVVSFGILLSLALSIAATSTFALASYHNYPGGVALLTLTRSHLPEDIRHRVARIQNNNSGDRDLHISIHMDVAACMTGVSRFGHLGFNDIFLQDHSFVEDITGQRIQVFIDYYKTENITDFRSFDWLLTEDASKYGKDQLFDIVEMVPLFQKIGVTKQRGVFAVLDEFSGIKILKRKLN